MPLIRFEALGAQEIANDWREVADDAPLATDAPSMISLARFKTLGDHVHPAPIGVRLEPADAPEALDGHLHEIDLIAIRFPRYTDGRGYSQAQVLRRRMGWQGELRAVGHVLRDQVGLMRRTGFDTVETQRADASDVIDAASRYADVYQPAADGRQAAFQKRVGAET